MKLYIKKLWTLNPRGYTFIALDNALIDYEDYLKHWHNAKLEGTPKTFEEWRKSEI